ncbi:TPA: hypothetical protein DDW35_12905 [Candidatus Sumerlaeota bacterium]|jgi:hypothetical protein|nr:hypothetical protein [Candidatus Sumerlaeota bacterium]
MGYDLHITRKGNWSENGPDIALEEWVRRAESDPSLQITDSFSADFSDGSRLTYSSEGLALWNGHSSENPIPFDFRGGQIVVKNPDEEIVQKMVLLAGELDATVQGDEGEKYPLEKEAVSPADSKSSRSPGRVAVSVILLFLFVVVVGLVAWLRGVWQALLTVGVAAGVFLMQRKNKNFIDNSGL